MTNTADQRQLVAAAVELREQGYSQRAIGERLGVAQNTISRFLRLRQRVSPLIDGGSEDRAVIADARRQLVLWSDRRRRLLPDRDDPRVLSELLTVESQLAHALHALDALGAPAGRNQRTRPDHRIRHGKRAEPREGRADEGI